MNIEIEINITTDNPKWDDFFNKMKDLPFYKEQDIPLYAFTAICAGLSKEGIDMFFKVLGFYHAAMEAKKELIQQNARGSHYENHSNH